MGDPVKHVSLGIREMGARCKNDPLRLNKLYHDFIIWL